MFAYTKNLKLEQNINKTKMPITSPSYICVYAGHMHIYVCIYKHVCG